MQNANVVEIQVTSSSKIHFDIKSQALAPALIEFGQQAGLSVLLQHALRDVKTQGLQGEYAPIAGLEALLVETGLEFQETDNGIVVSQPVARMQPIVVKAKPGSSVLARVGEMLAAVLISSAATAAEPVEPPSKVIEEIVVTAQKREGSLRKTPIAITALTADMIEKLDVSDIGELAKLAPSLTFNHAYAGLQLYIRGVGQDAPTVGNSPGVAVYVDGVYHGHQFANAATAVDAARIEVVRGPQGTLYGRNSTGGNINITSAKPHFGREVKLGATGGSDALQKFSITGNLPIKEDVVAVRATVATHERDGYRKNLFDGSDIDGFDSTAARFSVLVTPSSDLEILFSADYQKDKGDSRPATFVQAVPGSGLSPLALGGQTGGQNTDVYHDVEDAQDTELKGASATLTWQLANTTLKSITSYRKSEIIAFADADGTDLAFSTNTNFTDTKEFSQEFNLLGSALGEKLQWIVGVNYYLDDAASGALFHLPVFTAFFPPLPPLPTLDGDLTSIPFLHSIIEDELQSVGVFAQGTYNLTEQTRLTLGYRYTSEEKDVTTSVFSNITAPAAHCSNAEGSEEWTPSTFKIGLDHDFSDGSMMYASLSRGFKAGGFNVVACGGNPFDEETLDAVELGYKGLFFDGQLSLFSAAYFYDYADMQVRSFTPDFSVEFQNAAESEIYGVETEFVFQPSVNWRIDGGVNWQNAEYKKGMLDDSMIPGINEVDISGNQLLRAPDLKANLGVQYTHWLTSGGSVEARFDASFSDDYYVDAHENDFARIEERTLQSFRVTWTSPAGTTFVQLFGTNLTDEKHLEWLLNSPAAGGTVGMWGAPQTFGVRLGYNTL